MAQFSVLYNNKEEELQVERIDADTVDEVKSFYNHPIIAIYRVLTPTLRVQVYPVVNETPDPRDNTRLVLCGGELIEVGGASADSDEIPF